MTWKKESDLIRAGYDLTSEPQQLSFFVTGDLRITLISPDGDVIFESATDQPMENHLTRPEIVQALQGSIGKDIRDSQTMGYETYYYAVQLPGGNILRVAQDAETVWSVYDGALPAIVLSCVALMLAAAILSTLLTRALVQPVLNMTEDLDHIQDKVPYKELIPFAESIHADRILRENNEKMRQDFTANVSHELKTPLTSISGYAELIETGIAKPEDVPGFAAEDPWRSQPDDPAGERYPAALQPGQRLRDLLHAGNGGRGPAGRGQGVCGASEAERPPRLHHPDLSGRERTGAGQPQSVG